MTEYRMIIEPYIGKNNFESMSRYDGIITHLTVLIINSKTLKEVEEYTTDVNTIADVKADSEYRQIIIEYSHCLKFVVNTILYLYGKYNNPMIYFESSYNYMTFAENIMGTVSMEILNKKFICIDSMKNSDEVKALINEYKKIEIEMIKNPKQTTIKAKKIIKMLSYIQDMDFFNQLELTNVNPRTYKTLIHRDTKEENVR